MFSCHLGILAAESEMEAEECNDEAVSLDCGSSFSNLQSSKQPRPGTLGSTDVNLHLKNVEGSAAAVSEDGSQLSLKKMKRLFHDSMSLTSEEPPRKKRKIDETLTALQVPVVTTENTVLQVAGQVKIQRIPSLTPKNPVLQVASQVKSLPPMAAANSMFKVASQLKIQGLSSSNQENSVLQVPAQVKVPDPMAPGNSIFKVPSSELKLSSLILYGSKGNRGEYLLKSTDLMSPPKSILKVPSYTATEVGSLVWVQSVRRLYYLGGGRGRGFGGNVTVNSVFYVTSKSSSAKQEGPRRYGHVHRMIEKRAFVQPVVLGNTIYVFGGGCGFIGKNRWVGTPTALNSAEKFVIRDKQLSTHWARIAPMKYPRSQYSSAVVGSKIYVLGGMKTGVITTESKSFSLRYYPQSTVECYNPSINQWIFKASMKNCRFGHASVVVGTKIYVLGGRGRGLNDEGEYLTDDLEIMRSVEVYDTEKDTWTEAASMLRPRFGGSAVVMGRRIYALGGDQSSRKTTSSVEFYDLEANQWYMHTEQLDKDGLFSSVAFVENGEDFQI